MIPIPFPRVWHEMDDDGEHLDIDTVKDWAKLVTAFTAAWMDLEGLFDTTPPTKRGANEGRDASDERQWDMTDKSEL